MSGGNYYISTNEEDKNNINCVACQVLMLDGSLENFNIPKKSCGQCLLDLVFDTLELLERDYFGLQFKDSHPSSGKFSRWLNSSKAIKKQLTGTPPFNLQFKIRFFPTNPNHIKEDYTKYLLYLQLKKDLFEDRLYCSRDMAAILASYAVQSEVGDYNSQIHKTGYISKFKFVKNQTPEFEKEVSNLHSIRKTMSPTEAESEFLLLASRLSYYGVDVFNALTNEKDIVQIGPSYLGFHVFQNKKRIHLFSWTSIFKISYKKKRVSVQVKSSQITDDQCSLSNSISKYPQSSVIRFNFCLSSLPVCKNLWQNCVDYHVFYRLKSNNYQNHPTTLNSKIRFTSAHRRSSLFNALSKANHHPTTHYGNINSSYIVRKTMPFSDNHDINSIDSNVKRTKTFSDRTKGLLKDFKSTQDSKSSSSNIFTPELKHTSNSNLSEPRSKYKISNHPNNVGNNSTRIRKKYPHHNHSHNSSDDYDEPLSINKDNYFSKSYSSLATINSKVHSSSIAKFDSDEEIDIDLHDGEDDVSRDEDNISFNNYDNNIYCDVYDNVVQSYPTKSYSNSNKSNNNRIQIKSNNSNNTNISLNYLLDNNNTNNGIEKLRKGYVNSSMSQSNRKNSNCNRHTTNLKPLERFRIMNKSLDETSGTVIHEMRSNASLESLLDKTKMSGRQKNMKPIIHNHQDLLMVVLLYPDKDGRYGFTIKQSPPLCINNIARDSPADTCYPRLSVGDQVVAIGGIDVSDFTQEEAVTMVRRCADSDDGELKLTIRPADYMVDCEPQYIDTNNRTEFISDITSEKIGSTKNCSTIGRKSLSSGNDRLFPEQSIGAINNRFVDTSALQQSMKLIEIALENDELVRQFESVYRSKPGMTMNQAKKTENFTKNRYRDISPYDQTRVILKGCGRINDYINASIVNMQLNEKGLINRYIAAQGPLVHTLDHFWQMCWEQGTRLVVMLTSVTEGGRPKCHIYWPPLYETVEFSVDLVNGTTANLQVSCLSEEHRYLEDSTSPVIIRDLSLYLTDTGEERRMRHLQYASWPDHGVPMFHDEFLGFVKLVRSYRSSHQMEPVVVHCSAGIGRTGVLITMETALCLMETGRPIEPIEILRQMRDQRASMIQTPAQFIFVCEAILKVYKEAKLCDIR